MWQVDFHAFVARIFDQVVCFHLCYRDLLTISTLRGRVDVAVVHVFPASSSHDGMRSGMHKSSRLLTTLRRPGSLRRQTHKRG